MKIKGIKEEDFVQYKKPCMTIMFSQCDFKCDRECGRNVCINSDLAKAPDIEINIYALVKKYFENEIVSAICCGGLEPFDSELELNTLISLVRFCECEDDIVIYTGYTEEEVKAKFPWIYAHKNIIIKFGRFIPDRPSIFDEVLGVQLASDNQYAKIINP